MRPGVRPRMTRPASGPRTVKSRSSRPLAQTAPACLAGLGWPGRWPAARPGRCRRTAAVPPAKPPTRPVKVAYMPAGPGSGSRTSADPALAWSLQCCGRLQRTWATSAGDSSSQVCPKARPAACPVAHTSAPAPAVAPTPTARSWSPGLVNGGASGDRCPPGGNDGQDSCHIRVTPRPGSGRRDDRLFYEAFERSSWDDQTVADADGSKPACCDLAVQGHSAHVEPTCRLRDAVGQAVTVLASIG